MSAARAVLRQFTASKKLKGAPEALAPQAVTPGKFVRVMAGDFREV
jgi:hypothetical protein